MSLQVLALIVLSVAMSAIAQVILKTGMSGNPVASAIGRGEPLGVAMAVGTNPWVWGGLALYFLGALVWLFVLARIEVSQAYPFVGLGFIFTMLLGRFLLGDAVSMLRVTGTLLVVLGVILIART